MEKFEDIYISAAKTQLGILVATAPKLKNLKEESEYIESLEKKSEVYEDFIKEHTLAYEIKRVFDSYAMSSNSFDVERAIQGIIRLAIAEPRRKEGDTAKTAISLLYSIVTSNVKAEEYIRDIIDGLYEITLNAWKMAESNPDSEWKDIVESGNAAIMGIAAISNSGMVDYAEQLVYQINCGGRETAEYQIYKNYYQASMNKALIRTNIKNIYTIASTKDANRKEATESAINAICTLMSSPYCTNPDNAAGYVRNLALMRPDLIGQTLEGLGEVAAVNKNAATAILSVLPPMAADNKDKALAVIGIIEQGNSSSAMVTEMARQTRLTIDNGR